MNRTPPAARIHAERSASDITLESIYSIFTQQSSKTADSNAERIGAKTEFNVILIQCHARLPTYPYFTTVSAVL